jgi:uncharacterized protein (DUF2235 family)
MGVDNDWGRIKQTTEAVAGLALGYGLDNGVLEAYRFLANCYEKNDRIFLFGFSRGAYTVRVLAGFINCVGLLGKDSLNLSGYAFVAYKKISEGKGFKPVRLFEQAMKPRRPPIRFLGLWDTVSSIIIPRRDRFYIPSIRRLAYTERNPSVEIVRHALAIDEKRRMFRPFLWKEGDEYWGGPFNNNSAVSQDVRQAWFAGVHSDIGGGYDEEESGLSKICLKWMIDEAPDELQFVTQSVNQLVLGQKRAGSSVDYVKPDPAGKIHTSLNAAWWPLEWLPKRTKFREDPDRRSLAGFYLPGAERRQIPAGAIVHKSVLERMEKVTTYRPDNLPLT